MNRHMCGASLILLATGLAAADEAAIREQIRAFMRSQDPEQRAAIVARITSDEAYDRTRVSTWLHEAGLFESLPAGTRRLRVDLDDGERLDVQLRIPEGYDADRPWPLIYALHGTGGSAHDIIAYAERVLGERADEFLIAAPHGYKQVVLHSSVPATNEHPAALDAVRRQVHVDSDRVYAIGYSRGGHAAWTLALLHAERFAGVVPVAGTLLVPEHELLFPKLLGNVRHVPMLVCWGREDTRAADNRSESPEGGVAGMNRLLDWHARQMDLPLVSHQDAEKGHGGIVPPDEALAELLGRERAHYPAKVEHLFRVLYQANAYWLEGNEWAGDYWDDEPLELRFPPGKDPDDPEHQREALASAVEGRLGMLEGTVTGGEVQEISVSRRRIRAFTIWFGDGLIDWARPVRVNIAGRVVHEGAVEPSLAVCLSQAARTYDFDRLRWAGLIYRSGARIRWVDLETEFPAVAGEPGR